MSDRSTSSKGSCAGSEQRPKANEPGVDPVARAPGLGVEIRHGVCGDGRGSKLTSPGSDSGKSLPVLLSAWPSVTVRLISLRIVAEEDGRIPGRWHRQ